MCHQVVSISSMVDGLVLNRFISCANLKFNIDHFMSLGSIVFTFTTESHTAYLTTDGKLYHLSTSQPSQVLEWGQLAN